MIASSWLWLPAHEGDIDRHELAFLVPAYAVVAALAAVGIRRRAPSVRAALVSALPAFGILGAAVVLGLVANAGRDQYRGTPLYLYFGVALWASWAALLLSGALLTRAKWNGAAGIGLTAVIALFGYVLFIARID